MKKLKFGITRWLPVWKHDTFTFLQTMTTTNETFKRLLCPNLPLFPYGWRHWVPIGDFQSYIQTYAELEHCSLTETHWPRIQEEIRNSRNVYWSDITTEIERRGKALADAGCPPQGSEAWIRLVTPTVEQCEEYNAVIRTEWKKKWERAALLAGEYATEFAALPLETLVALCPCHFDRANSERHGPIWRAISARLPTETRLAVEQARDKEDTEREKENREDEAAYRRSLYSREN